MHQFDFKALVFALTITAPILLINACSKQSPPDSITMQLADQALQSERAWQILESLTTEVGPRLAGTDADKRAVAWAEKMLQESGFDKVWLEPVEFPVWRRHHEYARVLSPYPQTLTIAALGYSGSTENEMVGEVVMFETLAELQQTELDLHRKIVYLNQATERNISGAGYGATVPIRSQGPRVAKEKGAMGVLIRSVGTDHNRLPHTGATSYLDDPLPAAALSVPDADQLVRILAQGKPVTVGLDIQTSLQPQGSSFNVVAQINGSTKPEEVLLMGAHLDSWDLGTGAIDDGAGVAIISAAAQLISELPQRPARSIRVVLFANEEQNVWGAKAYADAHRFEADNHIVGSESDFGAGKVWQFDTGNQEFLATLNPVLNKLGIKPGSTPTSGGSDMSPMAQLGMPVFALRQDGTDYFDYHHTANDTLDKVDPQALKQNVAAWVTVFYTAANSEHYFREQTK